VRLYFGRQQDAKIVQDNGKWKTNNKSNGEWAACLQSVQVRSKKQGGNAVVGVINSSHNVESSSGIVDVCGSGAPIGVAFNGRVVKLAP
jgi:uncharacterized protein YbjQ (UPF0145 family)